MLKIAVCDDEEFYLKKISGLIEKILINRGISRYGIDTYLSGEDFVQNDRFMDYNLIFLDINMPEMNGLEIAGKIRESRQDILLVFVTAFMDYAMEGYKMEAIRFLFKDMLEEILPECMEAVIKKLSIQAHKIEYHFIEGKKEIPVDNILFVESQLHKLLFYVSEQRMTQYSIYEKLDNVEKELLPYGFLRIHKSFLINTKYIKNIVNYKVYLKNGEALPVPKEKFQKVKERYYEIIGEMI